MNQSTMQKQLQSRIMKRGNIIRAVTEQYALATSERHVHATAIYFDQLRKLEVNQKLDRKLLKLVIDVERSHRFYRERCG